MVLFLSADRIRHFRAAGAAGVGSQTGADSAACGVRDGRESEVCPIARHRDGGGS